MKYRSVRALSLLLLFAMNMSCAGNMEENLADNDMMKIGYDLSSPDKIYFLPSILHEISGITVMDASLIACIQDEVGTVFIFDLNKGQIIREIPFSNNGDYEGIARAGENLYILRSDGEISEIKKFVSENFEKGVFKTGIPWKDNEGLCYDQKDNRLLLAPKEIPKKKSPDKSKRFIYEFNLGSKELSEKPVITFDLDSIIRFAAENKIKIPAKGENAEPDIQFTISAIGINPVSGNFFAVSGPERLLFVFDINGDIIYIERLNSDLFKQPEGIAFMENGDMLISSEGKKESGILVRFNYKPATIFNQAGK